VSCAKSAIVSGPGLTGLPDFSWYNTPKWEKYVHQTTKNYIKWSYIKYAKITQKYTEWT
jgi:hypothetical protein